MTDRFGRYVFDVQSGVRTGDYRVRVVKNSSGATVTQVSQLTASITRGDQFVRGLDLAASVSPPTAASTAVTTGAQASTLSSAAPLVTSAGVDQITAAGIDQIMEELGTIRRRRV